MRFKLQTWFFIAFCSTSIGSKFQALCFPSRAVCGAVAVWFSKSRQMSKLQGHVVITRGWLRLCHTEQYVIQSSGWCSTAFSCINLASRLSWEKQTFQECAWPNFLSLPDWMLVSDLRLQLPQHSISPHSTNIRDIRTLIIAVTWFLAQNFHLHILTMWYIEEVCYACQRSWEIFRTPRNLEGYPCGSLIISSSKLHLDFYS